MSVPICIQNMTNHIKIIKAMFQGGRITKALLNDLKPKSEKREEKIEILFRESLLSKLIKLWKRKN